MVSRSTRIFRVVDEGRLLYWRALVLDQQPAPVEGLVIAPLRSIPSYHGATLVLTDRNERWWIKAYEPQDHRAAFVEQVVGRIGQLGGFPVPRTTLLAVPPELARDGRLATGPLAMCPPGPVHATRHLIGRDLGRLVPVNSSGRLRQDLIRLSVLFGLFVPEDWQVFSVREPAPGIMSFDHGLFFPGTDAWEQDDLRRWVAGSPAEPALDLLALARIDRREVFAEFRLLETSTDEMVASAVTAAPEEWGIGIDERAVVAAVIRSRIAQMLGWGAV